MGALWRGGGGLGAPGPVRAHTAQERRILGQMLARSVNSPVTTSGGRLFDGVAALLAPPGGELRRPGSHGVGVRVRPSGDWRLSTAVDRTGETEPAWQLDWQPLVAAMVEDLQCNVVPGVMPHAFTTVSWPPSALSPQPWHAHVALSGGCFQNRRLTEQTADRLRQAGFTVLCIATCRPTTVGSVWGRLRWRGRG